MEKKIFYTPRIPNLYGKIKCGNAEWVKYRESNVICTGTHARMSKERRKREKGIIYIHVLACTLIYGFIRMFLTL